jgi:spermidine synthase
VHKLAKYVPTNIKRVLWVGGGDSGLLNEVLKYPSLELVVGLELDQQVTRLAFKHFASRPHYDNPKVQWWYGDASKTLLMLPEEYFGSFDMVLVDLSDTLFSLTVSKELDVIETLSLLLRPGGVFSMNELFFKRVSDVFEYTIHYTYQDVPRVCDQSFIIASNDVDFLNQQLTHHKLDENATLFVENSSHKTLSQFDKVHDFRRNPHSAFQRLCKKDGDLDQTEEKPQIEAPGILMILEAENLTVDLDSTENIRIAMLDALERQGMQVLSNNVPSKSSSFTIVFSEGYLVARVWSKFNYVAVDLHLWSAFDKHDTLKTSIVVEALGGDLNNQSTTSYRIVAAGMYGLPTWKADRDMNGPKVSRACGTNDVVRDSPSDIDIFKLALETSLDVVQGRDLVIAVICDVGEESCPSLDVLTSHEKVKQVIPLHPCPTLAGDESEQHKCSMEGVELYLEEILPEDDDLIDAIIFDWDSPFSMHLSIDIMLEEDHLDIDNLFVFGVVDSKHDLWRRGAIDRLRHSIVVMDPVFRAHVLLNTTASSLEVALVSTGDLYFIENLSNAVTAVDRKREGVSSEVRNIIGGKWREDRKATSEDWEASIFMTEKDYDTSDALTQLRTQFPVATQSVSQFTHMSSLKPGEKVLIKNEDEYLATPWWVEGDVLSVNDDGTYEIQFTLDDIEDGFTRETIKRVGKDSDPPEIVPKEQLLEACRYAFYMRPEAEMNIYDDIGGSGLVCTGVWEKGEAIILWDGRYQVDINIWSIKDMDEVDDFEKSVLRKLPNLVQKLRDIQPRGFGRVVNFKDDVFRGKREGERLSEED